jgi:siroheme synthase-like protein
MRTHPVFVRLEGRRATIIGGGEAALGKVRACLGAGAEVTVVAAEPSLDMVALLAERGVRHVARAYRPGDLRGAFLAYLETTSPELARTVADEAAREHVLLNVIDLPEACDFLAPAVLERGELVLAIGTGGASPGLASRIRHELEAHYGPEYAPFVAILGAVRGALSAGPERRAALATLLDSPLLELVRGGRWEEIDRLLARVVGDGLTLERLGVSRGASA